MTAYGDSRLFHTALGAQPALRRAGSLAVAASAVLGDHASAAGIS